MRPSRRFADGSETDCEIARNDPLTVAQRAGASRHAGQTEGGIAVVALIQAEVVHFTFRAGVWMWRLIVPGVGVMFIEILSAPAQGAYAPARLWGATTHARKPPACRGLNEGAGNGRAD